MVTYTLGKVKWCETEMLLIVFLLCIVCSSPCTGNIEVDESSTDAKLMRARRIVNGVDALPNTWPWYVSLSAPDSTGE